MRGPKAFPRSCWATPPTGGSPDSRTPAGQPDSTFRPSSHAFLRAGGPEWAKRRTIWAEMHCGRASTHESTTEAPEPLAPGDAAAEDDQRRDCTFGDLVYRLVEERVTGSRDEP